MRVMTLALLGACSSTAIGVTEPGIGVPGTGPGSACLSVSESYIEIDGSGGSESVTIENDCGVDFSVYAQLDDPMGAFSVDQEGSIQVDFGDSATLNIELLAEEPGIYEAVLEVEGEEWVSAARVDLIGIVEDPAGN